MSNSSISRGERLVKLLATLNAASDDHSGKDRIVFVASDADVALLVDAIDTGELWRLLEKHPELDPTPSDVPTQLKWFDVVKAAMRPNSSGGTNE